MWSGQQHFVVQGREGEKVEPKPEDDLNPPEDRGSPIDSAAGCTLTGSNDAVSGQSSLRAPSEGELAAGDCVANAGDNSSATAANRDGAPDDGAAATSDSADLGASDVSMSEASVGQPTTITTEAEDHGLWPKSEAFAHFLSLIERDNPSLYRRIVGLG